MIFMSKDNCPYCGKKINKGDQRCIHCGQTILNASVSVEDYAVKEVLDSNRKSIVKTVIVVSGCIIVVIVVTFLVIWFGVLS